MTWFAWYPVQTSMLFEGIRFFGKKVWLKKVKRYESIIDGFVYEEIT